MRQFSINVNLRKNSVNSSIWLLILCKIADLSRLNFVGFDCRISPLGLSILDNGRENEIRLQILEKVQASGEPLALVSPFVCRSCSFSRLIQLYSNVSGWMEFIFLKSAFTFDFQIIFNLLMTLFLETYTIYNLSLRSHEHFLAGICNLRIFICLHYCWNRNEKSFHPLSPVGKSKVCFCVAHCQSHRDNPDHVDNTTQ